MGGRFIRRFGATGALALVLACGGVPLGGAEGAPPHDSAEEAVRARLDAYYADLTARDWNRFAAHFWPGAILSTVWHPPDADGPTVFVSTVPEYVALAPEGPDSQPIFEESLTDARVTVEGTVAHVWAHYEARFGRPGAIQEWSGVDAFTLLLHEGEWRIVSLAYAAS